MDYGTIEHGLAKLSVVYYCYEDPPYGPAKKRQVNYAD